MRSNRSRNRSLSSLRSPHAARLLLLVGLVGCGSEPASPFARFERLPSVKQLVTVPLGFYLVPVPVGRGESIDDRPLHGQVQLEFELHAAVLPKHESWLAESYERHEGRLHDSVIQICRDTPVEDLLDPTLTTLKAHLTDTLQHYFPRATIERLHLNDPQVKQL